MKPSDFNKLSPTEKAALVKRGGKYPWNREVGWQAVRLMTEDIDASEVLTGRIVHSRYDTFVGKALRKLGFLDKDGTPFKKKLSRKASKLLGRAVEDEIPDLRDDKGPYIPDFRKLSLERPGTAAFNAKIPSGERVIERVEMRGEKPFVVYCDSSTGEPFADQAEGRRLAALQR